MNSSTLNSKSSLKTVLVRFIIFISALFLFDRALFFLIHTFESSFYSRSGFEDQFRRYVADKHFDVLILGTSRAYEGLHPAYFEETFGVKAYKDTFQGKGPKYNYYLYRMYKKYAGVPKVVVYGVDYFIYTIESDPRWLSRFEQDIAGENIDYWSSPLLLLKYKKRIDTFSNNLLILFNQPEPREEKKDEFEEYTRLQEYTGISPEKKNLVSRRKGRFLRQLFPHPPGREGHYFFQLLEQLKQDGVTVVLVLLPDHIGSYKTNFQRSDFVHHLRTLQRTHKNLHIYNYNRPQQFPLDNDFYFIDGGYGHTNSHLTREGARELWRSLSKDLEKHFHKPVK